MKQVLFFCILSLFFLSVQAQCPVTAGFSMPDTVCMGDTISITNTSAGAQNYEWDFCSGDLEVNPTGTNLGNIDNVFTFPNRFTMVKDSGNYYGFVADFSQNKIYRLDFGTSLNNIPTSVQLKTSGGTISGPSGIKVLKEGNNWHAFVLAFSVNNIVRLDFGADIEEDTLIYNNLGNIGGLDGPMGLSVVQDSADYYAVVINYGSNNLSKLYFGNSLLNSISGSIIDPVPNSNNPWAIVITKFCNEWVGFISNLGNGNIIRAEWGISLDSVPTFTNLGNFGVSSISGMDISKEKGNYYLFVNNRTNNTISQFNFEEDLLSIPAVTNIGNLASLSDPRELVAIRDSSVNALFISNFSTKAIGRINFNNSCGANYEYSDSANVNTLMYTTSGTKSIQLSAYDTIGNTSFISHSVVVLPPPEADFSVLNNCYPGTTFFKDSSTASGDIIANWEWDIEGDFSGQQNPDYIFQDTGLYQVKLTIQSGFGCKDSIMKEIRVYNKPFAGFDLPPSCERDTILFTDTSSVITDIISSWKWNFGHNNDSSIIQNPQYAYDTSGVFDVSLMIETDKGCRDTVITTLSIAEKPDVSFYITNTCTGDSTNLYSTTVFNSGTINYTWNFGTGDSSLLPNPVYLFPDTGNYNVMLLAKGSNGCNDSLEQIIRISNFPEPDFSYTSASSSICQNMPVSFTDQSSVPGSDTIVYWLWSFGNGDSSLVQNPVYAYSQPGSYTVTLTIGSGTDCDSSITKSITILENPLAFFSHDNVCENDSTYFFNISMPPPNDNINSWDWVFGDDSLSSLQNPAHLYADTGNYEVQLTVISDSGCSANITDTIRIYANPQADFPQPDACSGLLTTFTDNSASPDDSIVSWQWNFADIGSGSANESTLSSPQHLYNSAGNYPVQLIVSTGQGCMDTTSINITVFQSPEADFIYSPTCEGEATQLDDNSLGLISSWQWDFADGPTLMGQSQVYFFESAGEHLVSLTVTDDFTGCYNSITKAVVVHHNPLAQIAHGSLCAKTESAFYDSSSVYGDSIVSWNWNVYNMDSSVFSNPVFFFNDTGNYQINLEVVSSKGCASSVLKTITAHPNPEVNFTFSPSFGASPLQVQFTDLSPNVEKWNWNFGDGGTGNIQDPSYIYQDTGIYQIKLTAYNIFGCQGYMQKQIKVMSPVLDIAILNVQQRIDDKFLYLSADLYNFGTRDIFEFAILAEASGKSRIKEQWVGELLSGSGMAYHFTAAFELASGIEPNFICLMVSNPNGENDQVPENNSKCTASLHEFKALDPYPNPVRDHLTIPFIVPFSDQVDIILYDTRGRVVDKLYSGEVEKGINRFEFNITGYAKSNYTYKIIFMDQAAVKSFVIY